MTKRASWKSTGALPKPAAAFADKRATLEMLQVHVLKNKQAEHLGKYKTVFKPFEAFATGKGIRYVDELDLSTLQEFRATWKDQSLTKSISRVFSKRS